MDAELACIEILREAITEPVHARLPEGVTYPCVRVQAIGGRTVVRAHMDAALLQLNVFGPADAKAQLRATADAARAALDGVDNVIASTGVVTGVDTSPPIWTVSDEPGLAQYAITATFYIHP
jgi:hypothetical protein